MAWAAVARDGVEGSGKGFSQEAAVALLTGPEIARRVRAGELVIEPFDPARVNPNSYDLSLGDRLLVYEKNLPLHEWCDRYGWPCQPPTVLLPDGRQVRATVEPLDMAAEEPTVELVIPREGLVLWPGVLYLGHTLEYTETPDLAPKIDGRSSVGRLGKMVHVTAGFGDVGFRGDWTLEIVVVHPLRVYPGVPVCQIAYSTVEGERQGYDGRYQGQRGPKASRLFTTVRRLLGL